MQLSSLREYCTGISVHAELDLALDLYIQNCLNGKAEDEKGQISGRLTFKERALSEINIDKLQAGSLYATGRIALTRTGEIDTVRLENIQLPARSLQRYWSSAKMTGYFPHHRRRPA